MRECSGIFSCSSFFFLIVLGMEHQALPLIFSTSLETLSLDIVTIRAHYMNLGDIIQSLSAYILPANWQLAPEARLHSDWILQASPLHWWYQPHCWWCCQC
jgi:hypothetical protein